MKTSVRLPRTHTRTALWLAAMGALAALLVAPACNTTEGVGRDVKSLGKGVEETAQDAKPK